MVTLFVKFIQVNCNSEGCLSRQGVPKENPLEAEKRTERQCSTVQ